MPISDVVRVLGSLRGANMNSTADQAITIASGVSKYLVTAMYVTNCSTSLTLAAGGLYTATAKGGTPIVAAVQVYSALTGTATQLLPCTIAAAGQILAVTASTLYLSLTTAQGGAATADVYIVGVDLT